MDYLLLIFNNAVEAGSSIVNFALHNSEQALYLLLGWISKSYSLFIRQVGFLRALKVIEGILLVYHGFSYSYNYLFGTKKKKKKKQKNSKIKETI